VTYCGSTERVSAAERDGRGYNLVSFEDETVDIRRRAVETRPFVFVEVTLGEGEGEERVREQVRQYDVDDAVVVVEITGDGDPVTPAAIETLATERGALVARVTDRREFEATGDSGATVDFADPDAAVRERVSELGLSPAALDVDDAVRGDVADANVRETVKRRVRERLDESVTGFEPADDSVDDAEGTADGENPADDAGAAGEGVEAATTETDSTAGAGSTNAESAGADSAADADADAEAGDADDESNGEPDEADPDAATEQPSRGTEATRREGDGQVSMEDYL
jgi:hypothetical protein